MFSSVNVFCRFIVCNYILKYNEGSLGFKDKLTNQSSCGGGLSGFVGLGSRLFSGASGGTSSSSSFTLGSFGSVTSVFSSDSSALIFNDMLVLSLFVLPEWYNDYFQVRGTTSSVRLRYSER